MLQQLECVLDGCAQKRPFQKINVERNPSLVARSSDMVELFQWLNDNGERALFKGVPFPGVLFARTVLLQK